MHHDLKRLLAVLCAGGLLAVGNFARAEAWTQMSANTNYFWGGIVSSADGKKLMATDYEGTGEGVYLSTNSGATWAFSYALNFGSRNVSTANGKKLAIEAWNGEMSIYVTTNSGATWSSTGTPPMGGWNNNIQGMISSADGKRLFVFYTDGTDNSGVYVSTDWGTTWSQANSLNEPWASTACTAYGEKLAGITRGSSTQVFVSTNAGLAWQPAAPISGQSASCILCTADGNKLMAANSAGLFISTNWGVTWSETNTATGGEIVSSADGALLLGMRLEQVNGNAVYDICTSTNLGASWSSNNIPEEQWSWVACSADGKELIATGTNGIWISRMVPSPQLNLSSSHNALNFSWIVPSTNMALQESSDLSIWSTLTNCPALNAGNLQDQLTLAASSSQSFFRLISQ